MRNVAFHTLLIACTLAVWVGCDPADKNSGPVVGPASQPVGDSPENPSHRAITAENNPTTLAGRGEPDLDDQDRPAAWVYIDGREGHFIEREGNWQLEWVIDEPVSSTPTFRVEVYEPLLGVPKDFNCVLERKGVAPEDGTLVYYGLAAEEGTFQASHQYSLLDPGHNFVIRELPSGQIVSTIDPLPAGTYGLAVGVKNKETGKKGLAVTYFTVAEE